MGHTSEKALQTLIKQGLLKGADCCKLEFCEHCILGKYMRLKFGSTNSRYKKDSVVFTVMLGDLLDSFLGRYVLFFYFC